MLSRLLSIKTNLIGTALTSVFASFVTVLVTNALSVQSSHTAQPVPVIASANTAIDCETGVYSPVQNKCVDQEKFDAEMKRLFAALGIDNSIYNLENTDQ